jgi:hypothetical protein
MNEKGVKEAFKELISDRSKVSDSRLKDGIGKLKNQYEKAIATHKKEQEDVENMLQNPVYLAAVQQAEEAKYNVSILQWKLNEAKKEAYKRFVDDIEAKEGEF